MITNPIIPIWLMIIICIGLLIVLLTSKKKNIIEIIIVILLFIVNLRFMIPKEGSKILSNDLDVLFVIDNTISMRAEDYNGSNPRINGVKEDCKYIIRELNGARFSIITFNHKSRIVTPYSNDINMTIEAIDVLDTIDETYAKGTSLNVPLEDIINSLKSAEKKDKRTRVIFFISDGEITDDSKLKSFKEISKHISNGAVLGYGTEKGGKIKTDEEYNFYVHDPETYEDAISKIDEGNLKKIASDLEIDYVNMNKQSNIDKVLKPIKKAQVRESTVSKKNNGKDIYYYFVIPLVILLLWEFIDFRRRV